MENLVFFSFRGLKKDGSGKEGREEKLKAMEQGTIVAPEVAIIVCVCVCAVG